MGGMIFFTDWNLKKIDWNYNMIWDDSNTDEEEDTTVFLPYHQYHLWIKVLKETGEINCIWDTAHCSYDNDGECHIYGCLNPDGVREYVWDINLFLASHIRAINFLRDEKYLLTRKRIYRIQQKAEILEDFMEKTSLLKARGARQVFLCEDDSDVALSPCPREWSIEQGYEMLSYEKAEEKFRSGEWQEHKRKLMSN